MSLHMDAGDCLRAKRMVFEGRKISKPQVIRLTGSHRGQRIKLYDGDCWIERAIDLP